jgi:hypothetical protein
MCIIYIYGCIYCIYSHIDICILHRFVWLTVVGFLKQMGLLARDRLEFVTLGITFTQVLVQKYKY